MAELDIFKKLGKESTTFWMMLKLSSVVLNLSVEAYYLEWTKGGGVLGKLEHMAGRWVEASELWRKVTITYRSH